MRVGNVELHSFAYRENKLRKSISGATKIRTEA